MPRALDLRDWRSRVRAAAFVIFAAWILLAPAYSQVFGGRERWVRSWQMYSAVGLGLVVPEFTLRRAGGEVAVVDRFALLGFENRGDAPLWLQRIRGRGGLTRVATALCEAAGPDADLRVSARIATRRGWRRLRLDDANVCVPAPEEGSPQ